MCGWREKLAQERKTAAERLLFVVAGKNAGRVIPGRITGSPDACIGESVQNFFLAINAPDDLRDRNKFDIVQ